MYFHIVLVAPCQGGSNEALFIIMWAHLLIGSCNKGLVDQSGRSVRTPWDKTAVIVVQIASSYSRSRSPRPCRRGPCGP